MIEMKNVTKTFDGFKALNGLNMTVEKGSVYLARPWRDYGLCSFENCTCGAHIAAEGFINWPGTGRDKTARFHETPPRPGRVTWANREREEA